MPPQAAQLAEVYWMSLIRDVPFSNYGEDETTVAAAGNQRNLPNGVTYVVCCFTSELSATKRRSVACGYKLPRGALEMESMFEAGGRLYTNSL